MNRVERMNAVLAAKEVDRVPVGMWYHYNPDNTVEEAVNAHFDFVKRVDLDLIKIMYDQLYTLEESVKTASDWRKIKPLGKNSKYFQKQVEILKGLADKGAGEYPIWMTMFGAFKMADMAVGDDVLMAHCKEDPESVRAGIAAIADSLCEWADGYLENGADAIFYSAQFGEVGRFTKCEWEKLVRPFDLQVLSVAEQKTGKYNSLHLCGEPEYGFKVHIERFFDYPGAMINWAIYPNGYEIERGKEFFNRPVMGGLNNHGVMAHGTIDEVKQNVKDLIDKYGTKGFMIGADCSIESKECEDRIKAAVDASKEYKY